MHLRKYSFLLILYGLIIIPCPAQDGGRVTDGPAQQPGTGVWMIPWEGDVNRRYQLQESNDLIQWRDLTTYPGGSGIQTAEDPTFNNNFTLRFWRLLDVGSLPLDATPPNIGPLEAAYTRLFDEDTVNISVQVTDPSGVTEVRFYDGPNFLGFGVLGADDQWHAALPLGNGQDMLHIVARAVDTVGNVGYSPALHLVPQAQGDARFVPLDENGNPDPSGVLNGTFDGTLPAFVYRPSWGNVLGDDRGISFILSSGATISMVDGEEVIQASSIEISFGENAPLKLASTGTPSPQGRSSEMMTLPLGDLRVEDFAAMLGLDPSEGIPFLLYDQFPVRWIGGLMTDYGFAAPEFELDLADLPLPGCSGKYADLVLDFANGDHVRLPFYGEWTLPDGSEAPPTLRASARNPIWVTLNKNGSIEIDGRVQVTWSHGGSVLADLQLADPWLRLQLSAAGVRIPLLDTLSDLLPQQAELCLPISPQTNQLEQSEACLRTYAEAYRGFSRHATAESTRVAGTDGDIPSAPPDTGATLASLFNAWTTTAYTPAAQLSMDSLHDLLEDSGEEASTSESIEETFELMLALTRAQLAEQQGVLTSAGGEVLSILGNALTEVKAALLYQLQNPARSVTLEQMRNILTHLADLQTLAGPDTDINSLVGELVTDHLNSLATRFGIVPGAFDGQSNVPLAALPLDELQKELENLTDLSAKMASQSLPTAAPLDELLSQYSSALYSRITLRLDQTEVANDAAGFAHTFRDVLRLSSFKSDGLLPGTSALDIIPTGGSLAPLVDRFNALLDGELLLPQDANSVLNLAGRIGIIEEILQLLPADQLLDAHALQNLHDRMEQLYENTVVTLDTSTLAGVWVDLVQARLKQDRISKEPGLISDSNSLGSDIAFLVDRLLARAEPDQNWSALDEASDLLLTASLRLIEEGNLELAQTCQEQAAHLMASWRRVAVDIWASEQRNRDELGLSSLADMLLPGDLTVERIRGALLFNRFSRQVSGSFMGELGLPKFDASLTIQNASFNTGAGFDLNAFGSLSFPEDTPFATIQLPEYRPLRVSYSLEEGIDINALANIDFENGLSLEGEIGFNDPVYTIRMAAGGLELDLLETLAAVRPSLPLPESLSIDELSEWTTYYREFNRSFNNQIKPANTAGRNPAESPTGTPPAFEEGVDGEAYVAANAHLFTMDQEADELASAYDFAQGLSMIYDVISNLQASAVISTQELFAANQPAARNPPETPRVLQLDFGSTEASHNEFAPSYQFEDFPNVYEPIGGVWNGVTPAVSGGLVYADGSSATGVTLEFGLLPEGGNQIDFNKSPTTFGNPSGQWDFLDADEIMRDGLWPVFGGPDIRATVAVRVNGLGAGHYGIFALVATHPVPPGLDPNFAYDPTLIKHRVIITTAQGSTLNVSDNGSFTLHPPDIFNTENWEEGQTYAARQLSLADGQSLIITSGSLPDDPYPVGGRIQGLQIVELKPQIAGFYINPGVIDFGQSAEIGWDVRFATEISIDRGVSVSAPRGTARISPNKNTTYTLRASNASGEVTQSLTLQVAGPALDYKYLADNIERIANLQQEAGHVLSKVTAQLSEQEEAEIFEKALGLVEQALDQTAAILENPETSRDIPTMNKALKSVLAVQSSASLLGSEHPLSVNFAEIPSVIEDTYARVEAAHGLTANGIDTEKVASFSSNESKKLVRDLLGLSATLAMFDGAAQNSETLFRAHMDNTLQKRFAALDADPTAEGLQLGPSTDTAIAETLEDVLWYFSAATTLLSGGEIPQVFASEIEAVSLEMQRRCLAALDNLPSEKWRERFIAVQRLRSAAQIALIQEFTIPDHSGRIIATIQAAFTSMRNQSRRGQAVDELEYTLIKEFEPSSSYADSATAGVINQRLEYALSGISDALQNDWSTEPDLTDGKEIILRLGRLQYLTGFVKCTESAANFTASQPIPTNLEPATLLATANAKYRVLTETLNTPEELARLNEDMLEQTRELGSLCNENNNFAQRRAQTNNPEQTAWLAEIHQNLLLQDTLADQQSNAFTLAEDSRLPIDLGLPGNLEVENVFGFLTYHRDTGYLQGGFGGRITFPDINAFFAIDEATLDSEGNFNITGSSTGPLPFANGINVGANITASGGLNQPFLFDGTGTMTIPNDGEPPTILSVTVYYDQANGHLRFDAIGDDLDQRFTDDFVLFNASTSLEVSPEFPGGKLGIGADAGLVAINAPLGATVSSNDFYVVIDEAFVELIDTGDGFSATMESGTIHLPEIFEQGLCPTHENLTGSSGPRIALSTNHPLSVNYIESQSRVDFSGLVAMRDIQFEVPGIDGFPVQICTADLIFSPGEAPLLDHLNAKLQLPFLTETAEVSIVNGAWQLDGFPSGTVQLDQTITLYESPEFALRLLGSETNGCAFTGIRVTDDGGLPALDIDGGIDIEIPPSTLSLLDGAPIVIRSCGGIRLKSGELPEPRIDFAQLTGDFRLGGDTGVALTDVDIILENITDLVNPGSTPDPFKLTINSGTLSFTNDVAFTIDQGAFYRDGSFNIDASATSGNALAFGQTTVEANIHASRDNLGNLLIDGSGTLQLSPGEETIAVAVRYDSVARALYFDGVAEDVSMQFTDDFHIFDAGFGFEVSPAFPNGLAGVIGNAGLFATGTLPNEPSSNDFHIVISDTFVELTGEETGFSIDIYTGMLHLPPVFGAADCPAAPPGSGPVVAIDSSNPIAITYATNSVSFSGDIALSNLLVTHPALPDVEAELCTANLLFNGANLPALSNVNGSMVFPLPDGQLVQLELIDGNWDLAGLPTGYIRLPNNLELFNQGGFSLSLLGDNPDGCAQAGVSLHNAGNNRIQLRLAGGMELEVPGYILSSNQTDRVVLKQCARFQIEEGQPLQFDLGELEALGDFTIGGSDVAITDVHLIARNITSLFDSNPQQPFQIEIASGRLQLPGGADVLMAPSFISQNGTFSISATADAGNLLEFTGLEVEAGFIAERNIQGLFTLGGSGTLTFTESGNSFDADILYDQEAHRISFNAQGNDLDLRFTDDFVIFDAGFGFELSDQFTSGVLTAHGSAGIGARQALGASAMPDDFYLVATDIVARLQYDPEGFTSALDNGTLVLPDFFDTQLCPPNGGLSGISGPAIGLDPAQPVVVRYDLDPARVHFTGAIEVRDIGFTVPGIDDLSVSLCTASLAFNNNTLPVLSNVTATVSIPLPEEPAILDVTNVTWNLNGYPSGVIALRNDIDVVNLGGFVMSVLGNETNGCTGSQLSIVEDSGTGLPQLDLAGGIRLTVPADLLTGEDGSAISAFGCGSLQLRANEIPTWNVASLGLGPIDLRLGGADGLIITNGSLTAINLENIFNQSESTPFELILTGGIEFQGAGFGLEDATFAFIGEELPVFTIGGINISTPSLELTEGFGAEIQDAALSFKQPATPLPELIAPTNLEFSVTATAEFGVGDFGVSGQLDDLRATVDQNGNLIASINGIGMGIGPLPLGPIVLDGNIYLGGLNGNPGDWYMAGRVAGNMVGQSTELDVILAINQFGLLGACLDVNLGQGITLGQTTLQITGLSGGVAFLDRTADPCDFSSFLPPIGEDGVPMEESSDGFTTNQSSDMPAPMLTWDEWAWVQQEQQYETSINEKVFKSDTKNLTASMLLTETTNNDPGPSIPCPEGPCPPATVGILCQPHPDTALYPNRVIYKFTSLDEAFVNNVLGITEATFGTIQTPAEIADFSTEQLVNVIDLIVPQPDLNQLAVDPQPFIDFYNNTTGEVINAFHEFIEFQMTALLDGGSNTVYDAFLAAAYAGIPCPKLTWKLAGNLSQVAVSSFGYVQGGILVSSDITRQFIDSAGVIGTLHVMGLELGGARAFVSLTDQTGQPNPSLCGELDLSLGPIEFGGGQFLYECPECITGVLAAMPELFTCVGEETVELILAQIKPDILTQPYTTTLDLLPLLDSTDQMTFISTLMSTQLGGPELFDGLAECFFAALSSSWDSIQPTISLCGSVQPKIFGFPLASELVSASLYADKTNLVMNVGFSPSSLIADMVGLSIFPSFDQATMGVGLELPDAGELFLGGLSGRFNSPDDIATYAIERFDDFADNATFTFGYEFTPFGFKVVDGEGRLILPNFADHPAFNSAGWQPPENLGYPSRVDALGAALTTERLANPLWKGSETDFYEIFPEGSPERAQAQVNNLTLKRDYFPHGGLMGAINMALPPVITDPLPDSFYTMIYTNDPVEKVLSGIDFISNHVLPFTNEVGRLTWYLPAPNPPQVTDTNGAPLSAQAIMDAMLSLDIENLDPGDVISIEHAFMQGYMDGSFLGIPIGTASLLAVPPSATNSEPYMRIEATVPNGSWLSDFMAEAQLEFELRQPPPLPLEQHFTNVVNALDASLNGTIQDQQDAVSQALNDISEGLPKASLEVSIDNFTIPSWLSEFMAPLNGNASLYAYSPFFDPMTTETGPVGLVRSEGGIAIRGNLRFGDYIDIDQAELAIQPNPIAIELSRVTGLFDVPLINVPGGITITDASLEFDNFPPSGEPFLKTTGTITPFDIGGFTLAPVTGPTISGELALISQAPLAPSASLAIDASILEFPVGHPLDGTTVTIHGATPTNRFTFSSTDPWNAAVSIDGGLLLRAANGDPIVRIGTSGQDFTAAISGDGLSSATISLTLPLGIALTAYPGTAHEETLTVGAAGAAVLTVSSDGTFSLSANIEDPLALAGVPVGQVNSDASLFISNTGVTLNGSISGGTLAEFNAFNATATVNIALDGTVSVNGSASLPPLQYGVMQVTAAGGGNIVINVDENGLDVPTGARLTVDGVSDTTFILQAFTIQQNGNFDVVATGTFNVPGYFELDGGLSQLKRTAGVVTYELTGPSLTVFNTETYATQLPLPLQTVVVSSNGRFYYDSGTQNGLGLPGTITASGRLEFGYEPDANAPVFSASRGSVAFGIHDVGSVVEETIQITNAGGSQLFMFGATTGSANFQVMPNSAALAPGESQLFTVRFYVNEAGPDSGFLQFAHNGNPSVNTITLTGEGRVKPGLYLSQTQVDFGEQLVGGGALRRITLANIGAAELDVPSITAIGSGFSVSPASATLAPGDSTQLFITYRPSATGSFNGSITLASNDENSPHTVTLTGSAAQSNWYIQRDNSLGSGGSTLLTGIAMRNDFTGIAVGENGEVLTTNDGGLRWTPRNLTQIDLNGIHFSTKGWAFGRSGLVLQTTDLSNMFVWTPVTDPDVAFGGNNWNDLDMHNTSLNLAILVGETSQPAGGIIRRETSAGQFGAVSIFSAPSPLPILHGISMAGSDGIAVGEQRTVLRTANGGASWTGSIALPSTTEVPIGTALRGVAFTGSNGVIVGDAGTILRTTNGGTSWAKVNHNLTTATLRDVVFSGSAYYVTGDNGVFLEGNASADSWTLQATSNSNNDYQAVSVSNGKVWIAGEQSRIEHRPLTPPADPIMTMSTSYIDFGTVKKGEQEIHTMYIRNRGTDDLVIDSITAGNELHLSQQAMTIPPGGVRALQVSYIPVSDNDPPPNQANRVIAFNSNSVLDPMYVTARLRSVPSGWQETAFGQDYDLQRIQFTGSTGYIMHPDGVLKSTNSGANWSELNNLNPPGPLRAMWFGFDGTGYVSGGIDGTSGFILRTTNGGFTWSSPLSLPSTVRGPVIDLSFDASNRGYAITPRTGNPPFSGGNGVVIKTSNGTSWTKTSADPTTSFDGRLVHTFSVDRVFAASGGRLWQSQDGGNSWTENFNLGGAFSLLDLYSNFGFTFYAGGNNGALRYTASPLTHPSSFSAPQVFTSGTIQRIHAFDGSLAWCLVSDTSAGQRSIYRTLDGGNQWSEELTVTGNGINDVWGMNMDSVFAVGPQGRIWRYNPVTPEPQAIPILPEVLQFGAVEPQSPLTQNALLQNAGDAPLSILSVDISGDIDVFRLAAAPASPIAAGDSVPIAVEADPQIAGTYSAVLRVTTDGQPGVLETELSIEVTESDRVLVFDSQPAGIVISIGGISYTTPTAFTVASSGADFVPGESVLISAPTGTVVQSTSFTFQQWTSTGDATFSLTVPSESATYLAQYAPTELPPPAARQATFAAFPAPTDLPGGPWIRLSDASLNLPAIGDVNVEGAVFLSSSSIEASLEYGAFRVPESTSQPELLSVSGGSWSLDYKKDVRFQLTANAPGVSVLDYPLNPPVDMTIDLQTGGDFSLDFNTLDDLILLPGIAEIGPGMVQLQKSGAFHALTLDGTLRLLQQPNGWAFEQPVSFAAEEGPFSYVVDQLPDPLFNAGIAAIGTSGSSAITLTRDTQGAFSVSVANLHADLFGQTLGNLSGTASTSGDLTLSATAPANPFILGPFRAQASNAVSLDWNVISGDLVLNLPQTTLTAPGVAEWPAGGVTMPAVTIDTTGDFTHRFALPTFDFDGIAITAGGGLNDNYLELKKTGTQYSLALKDHRTFFASTMDLSLAINSLGNVSGTFAGNIIVDANFGSPFNFGTIDFGALTLTYDSGASSDQFKLRRNALGQNFGIYFGSNGARFCTLLSCTSSSGFDGCTEWLCLP